MSTDEFPRVVSFSRGRPGPSNTRPVTLPREVSAVRDTAVSWLFARMKEVFAAVDDSLFETAEKVNRQDEQDGIFQALRSLRLERHRLIDRFVNLVGQGFAEIPEAGADDSTLEEAEEPAEPGLALVEDEDLEQQVALKGIIAAARRDFASPIAEMSLRLDTLLPVKVYDGNMPLAPVAICRALRKTLKPLDIHLRARLIVLKKFEKLLAVRLGELYGKCNQVLVEKGVLPDLKDPLLMRRAQSRGSRTPVAPPGSRSTPAQPSAGPVPDGQGDVAGAQSPGFPGYQSNSPGGVPAAGGHASGAHGTGAAPVGGGHAPGAQGAGGYGLVPAAPGVASLATPDLLQHLGELQVTVPMEASSLGTVLNVNTLLEQRLVQAQQKASLEELDTEVIRMVDMLFSFMLEDRNLAEPIKVQLIRLQLPLLKLAVADKTFFSKGGHPARRLFNALADAAIGWQARDNYREDRFYREVCQIVERVLQEFENDEGVFQELLQDFDTFVSRERVRARIMEKRTLDEVQGKARIEAAKARVAAVFDALTAERQLPRIVHIWLNRVWNNVLFRACLKEGTDSESWRRSVLTARDLVWSAVAPMPESSFKMQQLLPGLRQRLKDGAESLSINRTELERLLGGLDTFYRERQSLADRVESERERRTRERLVQELLREADSVMKIPAVQPGGEEAPLPDREPDSHPGAEAAASADNVELEDSETDLPAPEELDRLSREAVVPPQQELPAIANTDEHWRQTYHLKGSWFMLQPGDSHPTRCRLAAIIRDLDQFMFVNRSGVKVAVYSRLELAHALRSGNLKPLEDGPLFERALRYVMGNIGETKIAVEVDEPAAEPVS
ncbi:DUF1631 domain-containing protein [Microbulbifer zhoushanensis]|uniref:DUF1631 domain-containing protein n=1 Tax=Microbulbifer zhoushanensis TaxID=2904254 RepID=UPI002107BBF8|nr:DUF1631 domain-containing protein [Microbulbifer zhoushanensis]